MKKAICRFISTVLLAVSIMTPVAAETYNDWLGRWYLYSFQDPVLYPDTIFLAGDETEYIGIYSDGTDIIAVFNNECGYLERSVRDCIWEGDTMTCMGSYTLKEGQLIRKLEYNNVVEAIYVYTREKPENLFANFHQMYYPLSSANDVDGTWNISRYGMNRAYVDADDMSMSGIAVFDNGKLTMTWTRDGVDKNAEIQFDSELNNVRLYTVINDSTSYIVTKVSSDTLILNIGLNSTQWVFTRVE